MHPLSGGVLRVGTGAVLWRPRWSSRRPRATLPPRRGDGWAARRGRGLRPVPSAMNFVSLWITDASVCGCSSSLGLCSGSMYRQIMRGGSGGRARCRSLPLTLHDRWTVVAAAGVGAGGSGGGGDAGSRCAPAAPAAPTGAYRPGVTAAPPQRPRRPTPHAPTRSRRWPPPTRRRPPGAAPVPARSLERIPQAVSNSRRAAQRGASARRPARSVRQPDGRDGRACGREGGRELTVKVGWAFLAVPGGGGGGCRLVAGGPPPPSPLPVSRH